MREPGQRSVRDAAALLGALVIHAGALVAVALAVRPLVAPALLPPPAHQLDSVDVDLVPLETVELGEPPAGEGGAPHPGSLETSAPSLARSEVKVAARPAATSLARTPEVAVPAASLDVASEGAASAPPSDPAASAAAGPERPIDLGLRADGWSRWLAPEHESEVAKNEPSTGAPLVPAPKKSRTGGLAEGLAEADRERLVGPSGRVVNALEGAAHGEGAAAFGVARFAVTVLRSGSVEVSLESASSGEAEWKRVAQRALENLQQNVPVIRPPSDGERFVIDVSAEMRLPDGRRKADLYGPRVEATPPRIHGWEAGKKDMLLKNPTAASGLSRTDQIRANVELPGVYVAQNGKVCSYRFGLSVLGPLLQGGCELGNLGVKPQRVVHAHVTKQELF